MFDVERGKALTSKKRIRKFTIISLVYFFFNSFLLPEGLLYTTILTPVFYLWLKKEKTKVDLYIFFFLIVFLFFFIIHFSNGIMLPDYLRSSINIFCCFIFCIVLHTFFGKYSSTLEFLFQKILDLGLYLTILCFLLLPLRGESIVWNFFDYNTGRSSFPRLQMLTYEPSALGYLLAPLALFYFQYFYYRNINKKRIKYLMIILLLLFLSFSFGALSGILLSLGLFITLNFILGKRSIFNFRFLIITFILTAGTLFLIHGPFQNSAFVERLKDILAGTDSSVNNRSWQAYFLADQIVRFKSEYFGIGPGQLKIIGADFIHEMYGSVYNELTGETNVARIPAAMADTIVAFGYVGGLIRISIEIFLFFRTQVYKSSFRLCIFFFVFFTQLVHGYITNIPEYVLWILCFSNVFPDSYFKRPRYSHQHSLSNLLTNQRKSDYYKN